jgi:hypothetical protein
MMTPRKAAWLLALLLAILSACGTFDLKTEHEPSTDFSRYKTFSFADPAEIGEVRTSQEVTLQDRIEPAIAGQLRDKGLQFIQLDQQPDLVVYYWVNIKGERRKAWNAGYARKARYGHPYREGTLVLDLVEPIKQELVWRATIAARLEQSSKDNVDLAIKAVEHAFVDYPPREHSP